MAPALLQVTLLCAQHSMGSLTLNTCALSKPATAEYNMEQSDKMSLAQLFGTAATDAGCSAPIPHRHAMHMIWEVCRGVFSMFTCMCRPQCP